MKYYELIKKNGESRYYYLNDRFVRFKKRKVINFLEDLEMEGNFTSLIGGLFEISNKPICNKTLAKQSSYTIDISIEQAIIDSANIWKIDEWDYVFAKLREFPEPKLTKQERLCACENLINLPNWDGLITAPEKLFKYLSSIYGDKIDLGLKDLLEASYEYIE